MSESCQLATISLDRHGADADEFALIRNGSGGRRVCLREIGGGALCHAVRRRSIGTRHKRSSEPGFLMGKIILIIALFGLLGAAVWFAVWGWTSLEGSIPPSGYVAMALGIVFSLVIGCGLMALIFYSSRHGYDEPAQQIEPREHD
jgi:hypothetical protein